MILLPGLLIIFLFFLYLPWKASKGIDFTDEGFYLSQAHRFILGDRLLSDSLHIPSYYHLVLYPLFRLFPDISLFQIRLTGFAVQTVSAGILFACLIRTLSFFSASAACIFFLLINNFFGIMSPSYNSLPSAFSLAAATFYVMGGTAKKIPNQYILGVLSSLCIVLSGLCHADQFAMTLVPLFTGIFILFSIYRQQNKPASSDGYSLSAADTRMPLLRASVGFLGTMCILGISALILIHITGIKIKNMVFSQVTFFLSTKPWKISTAIIMGYPKLLSNGFAVFPILAAAFGADVFCRFRRLKSLFNHESILSLGMTLLIFYAIFYNQSLNLTFIFFMIASLFYIFYYRGLFSVQLPEKPEIILIIWGTLSSLLFAHTTTFYNAQRAYLAFIQGIGPLFAVVIILFFKMHIREQYIPQAICARIPGFRTVCITLVLLPAAFFFNARTVYRDAPLKDLTERFSYGKLRGIYSTAERVKPLEKLLIYLDLHLQREDFFAAWYDLPLLHFLTDSRPALKKVWCRDEHSVQMDRFYFDIMQRENRTPEIIILSDHARHYKNYAGGTWQHFFITEYKVVLHIPPYTVLKKKTY